MTAVRADVTITATHAAMHRRDAAYARVTRRATLVSLVTLPAAVVVVLLAGNGRFAAAVVVAGLLVGVPHGALDHLVPTYHRPGTTRAVLGCLVVAYVGGAAVVWLVWQAAPAVGLAVFLAPAALHFGSGETTFAALRAGRADERSWFAAPTLGATVVCLPVLVHRDDVAPYLGAVVPGWDGMLPAGPARLGAALVVCVALGVAATQVRRHRRLEAVETLVLLTSALGAPAAVSVAVFFDSWHSVRHLALLLADDPANRSSLGSGRLGPPARRLAARAAAPSVAALLLLALLWWQAGGDVHDFVATDVAFLAALTVPHAVVVWWSDAARSRAGDGWARSPLGRRGG